MQIATSRTMGKLNNALCSMLRSSFSMFSGVSGSCACVEMACGKTYTCHGIEPKMSQNIKRKYQGKTLVAC